MPRKKTKKRLKAESSLVVPTHPALVRIRKLQNVRAAKRSARRNQLTSLASQNDRNNVTKPKLITNSPRAGSLQNDRNNIAKPKSNGRNQVERAPSTEPKSKAIQIAQLRELSDTDLFYVLFCPIGGCDSPTAKRAQKVLNPKLRRQLQRGVLRRMSIGALERIANRDDLATEAVESAELILAERRADQRRAEKKAQVKRNKPSKSPSKRRSQWTPARSTSRAYKLPDWWREQT